MKPRARHFLSDVCGFLADAFLPPTPALARHGDVPGLAELLRRHGVELPAQAPGVNPGATDATPPSLRGIWQRARLESAYQSTFRGRLFRPPLGLPTAADYLGQPGQSQEICRALEMFYRAFGFNYVPDVRPDHLAVQWSFARFLLQTEETTEQAAQGDKLRMLVAARMEFARVHLAPAVPAVFQRLAARARHPFYRGVASLAEEVVQWLLEKPVREAGDSRVADSEQMAKFDPSRVGYFKGP